MQQANKALVDMVGTPLWWGVKLLLNFLDFLLCTQPKYGNKQTITYKFSNDTNTTRTTTIIHYN